jgi:thiamine pyrophosphokinase
VKNGGDFDKAKKEVVAHCKSDVRNEFKSAKSDEDFIKKLNQIMVKHETGFAKQFEKEVNNLQLSYIITSISGNLFNEILGLGDGTVREKSNKYKKIVDYNALTHIAEKVASNELSKEDVCRTVC